MPSRSEYAALAVYELALAYNSSESISARTIAEKHHLSVNFLIQILQTLRQARLLEAAKGSKGGYRLLVDPKDLALGYVVALVESSRRKISLNIESKNSSTTSDIPSSSPQEDSNDSVRRILDTIWSTAEAKRQEYLNGVLFSELIAKQNSLPFFDFVL